VEFEPESEPPRIKNLISGENEKIDIKEVTCQKAVEGWLKQLDEKMYESI